MGVPFQASVADASSSGVGRKAQALNFISDYLVRHGHSPSIGDIAVALGVGKTRAKALVHQLANDKAIERAPGAQRAISVPGLFERMVLDRLRAQGWRVNEDARAFDSALPCPQKHLPLVAVLDHIPEIDAGDHHAQSGIT